MPTLNDLTQLNGMISALAAWIAGFIVWTITLWAIGTAVFRSPAGQVFLRWLWTHDKTVVDEVNRLKWEITNGLEFTRALAELFYQRKMLMRAIESRSRKSSLPEETQERKALDAKAKAIDSQLARIERRSLTLEELDGRRARLLELDRANWWKRILTYLINDCSFCQQFWVALAAGLVTRIQSASAGDVVVTAFLYAGSCSLLIWAVSPADRDRRNGKPNTPCPSGKCGSR